MVDITNTKITFTLYVYVLVGCPVNFCDVRSNIILI